MTSTTSASAIAAGKPADGMDRYVHLLVVYIVWGSAYFAVKLVLSGSAALTALQLQSARLTCAALLQVAVALWLHGGPPKLSVRDMMRCAGTGLLMWIGGNGLATMASPHSTSSFIVMALGTIPLWGVAIECVFQRKAPQGRVLAGLLLGLAGLGLVIGPGLWSQTAPVIQPGWEFVTVVLLLGAGVTWALGTSLQKPLASRLAPAWLAAWQMGAAAVVLLGLASAEGAPLPSMPDAVQWSAFAFLVVFGSVVSLTSYVIVVRRFSPLVASTFAFVNPVVGMLLGHWVLGEPIAAVSLLGFAIVLTSVGLVLHWHRKGG